WCGKFKSIIQISLVLEQTFAAKSRTNFWSGLKSNKKCIYSTLVADSVANVGLTSITKPMMSVSNPNSKTYP
ncbi:hypothetical protein ACQ5RZ_10530, partial [Lactobacillus delbrueckii subsp. bulgaricus]